MFTDSSVLEYSDSLAFTLKGIRIPNRLHRTTTHGTFTIKWLTSCLLSRQRETKCRQEKPTGRLRQSEVFFPLAILAHYVVPPGICPGLIQNHPDHVFNCVIVIFDKVWRTSTMFASLFLVSEEYRITLYKLKDYQDL